jgi:hypothetical protein
MLYLAILGGCVWTIKAKNCTMGCEVLTKGLVVEFSAVVRLQRNERKQELSSQWKSPNIMGKIIDKHKIVFKSRPTSNRRCPNISMYDLKGYIGNRIRGLKWKPNMFSILTRRTDMS